jgi:branched-chain amino acid transport system permease protein
MVRGIWEFLSKNQSESEREHEEEKIGIQSVLSKFHSPYTIGKSSRFWRGFGVVLLGILLYPFLMNNYAVLLSTNFFIWSFLALSLTLVWGYTGIFSFGQTAFFGLGAYIYGVVAINLLGVTDGTNLALLFAILLPAAFAAVLG